MSITVISPGFMTTVQDLGRKGLQQYGLPVSGAMDTYSARAANILVGNSLTEAVLEATLLGPTLKISCKTCFAVTGGRAVITLNGVRVPSWQCTAVSEGDEISIGPVTSGARVYLAIAGGFDLPLIMGSKSTFLRGNMGGLEGRALKAGDQLGLLPPLTCTPGAFVPRRLQTLLPEGPFTIRVMVGPQQDRFTDEAITTLLSTPYKVTPESDRMGYRLEGESLRHRDKADIVSDGIAPGSIQVPGHGQPIIMLADRQTTGGYAKIATVITADLPLLAQTKPGDTIQFVSVNRAVAVELLRKQQSMLGELPDLPMSEREFTVTVGGELINVHLQEIGRSE